MEQDIQRGMFRGNSEKTFIDKLLAQKDADAIRELVKKKKLTRSELLELLYMLTSNETKLLNYGEWDRYVQLKFFVWIREFIKVAELLYDFQEFLLDKEKLKSINLSDRTKQMLENNERKIEHNAKFLIDLYFSIGRSTLSLNGTGFFEILKNKYEIHYPTYPVGGQPEKKGFMGWGK